MGAPFSEHKEAFNGTHISPGAILSEDEMRATIDMTTPAGVSGSRRRRVEAMATAGVPTQADPLPWYD